MVGKVRNKDIAVCVNGDAGRIEESAAYNDDRRTGRDYTVGCYDLLDYMVALVGDKEISPAIQFHAMRGTESACNEVHQSNWTKQPH